MSTKDPNMKVIFGSDTKDFDKGAKAVKQGLKDLDKSSQSMLASLSGAFGVSAGKVEQVTSAMRGLGAKMTEAGNAGVKAFGSVLSSITPLGGAIAGIGIAAAIAGFKQLLFPVLSAVPHRPDRMDHVFRRQPISPGNLRLTGFTATQGSALRQQFRPGRRMDGAVHASAAQQ